MIKSKIQRERGVSLYMVFMIMTLLLGIGFGMSTLLLTQLDTLKGIGYSVLAFYATDAGIERAIYEDTKGCAAIQDIPEHITCLEDRIDAIPPGEFILSNTASFALCNAAGVCVETGGEGGCPETHNYCVKSTGFYQQARRAVRIGR
jgi:hypothetical protein